MPTQFQDPHAQQHLGRAASSGCRATATRSRPRSGDPDAILRALGGHARDARSPTSVQGGRRAPAPAPTTFRSRGCRKRGVPVFNAPGANANAVKELVHRRAVPRRAQHLPGVGLRARARGRRRRSSKRRSRRARRSSSATSCRAARSASIGLGAIGVEVANAAHALGMRVLGFDPQITVQRAWQLSSGVEQALSLDDLFARSDLITRARAADRRDARSRQRARLRLMRNGGIDAEFRARAASSTRRRSRRARQRQALRYVCDFPTSALKDHPKVVALPHLGASTRRGGGKLRDDGRGHAARLPRARQHPALGELSRGGRCRARRARRACRSPTRTCRTWSARSRPRWPTANLNIADLLNKSRGDLAYTLIDIDGAVPEAVLDTAARDRGRAGRAHRLTCCMKRKAQETASGSTAVGRASAPTRPLSGSSLTYQTAREALADHSRPHRRHRPSGSTS